MGFILVILSAVLFGIMPLLAKQIYAMGGDALTLCVHRFLFSVPFLFLIVRRKKNVTFALDRRETKKVLILSLGCAATPLLLFQSYQFISSGMATTIHFVYPILVLLGCVLIYREKMTAVKGICAALCLAGILCFYTPGEPAGLKGVALAFASGITYAFYILYYSRSGLSELDPYKLSFYLSIFSTIFLLLAAVPAGGLVFQLPLEGWLMSVGFAFMVSVVATVFFQMGTRLVGPEKASLLSTFEPLTSVIAGILFFQEKLTLRTGAGIAFILSAVLLLTLWEKKSR